EDSSRQWVSKLLVVGEGGVGKTSLLRALRGGMFDGRLDSTHGIQIGTLDLTHPTELDVTMTLNTWDFGGQEIYHATHQFFMTNRSLFILLVDNRRENPNLCYWLNIIELLSNSSPVLLVQNEKQDRRCQINVSQLRRDFDNL